MAEPKRHLVIPDVQARPGVPLDHLPWIGKAAAEYRPHTIVCLGDFPDFASLNSHAEPGSAEKEGRRYQEDVRTANDAFAAMDAPIIAAQKKHGWRPRKVYLKGNHDDRADRAAEAEPKWLGHISSDDFETPGWERHEFLEVVNIDGVNYAHFFQSSHSARAIGGSILNKLNKINGSFCHGHVQGLDMGTKMTPLGRTLWGIAAGSCYLHQEAYRGRQGQRHWQGIVVLNEVEDGEFCPMPLTLGYLCRKYENMNLLAYMNREYPGCDWRHLASGGLNGPTDLSRNAVLKASGGAGMRPQAGVQGRGGAVEKGNGRVQPHRPQPSRSRARRA